MSKLLQGKENGSNFSRTGTVKQKNKTKIKGLKMKR